MRVTGLPPSIPLQPKEQPDHELKAPAVVPVVEEHSEQGEHRRQKRGIFTQMFRRTVPPSPPRVPSLPPAQRPSIRVPGGAESPKPPARVPSDRFKDVATRITGQPGPSVGILSQSHPTPKNLAEVTQNLIVADRLHKAGVFPTSPQLGTVARDAFVNAGINGLVSAPLSIATYAGSAWTGEAIKGQYAAQTPLLPPVHLPAPSTQVGAPTAVPPAAEALDSRLALAELRIEVVANNIMAVRQGTDAPALKIADSSSGSPGDRLTTLEALYGVAEKQLTLIGEENDMIFRPYVPSAGMATTDQGRLDALEKQFELVNKFIGKLIVLKSTELPEAGTAGTQTV